MHLTMLIAHPYTWGGGGGVRGGGWQKTILFPLFFFGTLP